MQLHILQLLFITFYSEKVLAKRHC